MKPWDQQPDEPDPAYRRFLFYRNLGPTRSGLAAYHAYLEAGGAADAGSDRQGKASTPPGQWTMDSVRYKWPERAVLWDVEWLQTNGVRAVAAFTDALTEAALRLAEAMKVLKPADWEQAMKGFEVLAKFLNSDVVRAVQSRHTPDQPAGPAQLPG